jgi:hypothetical protein
VSKLLTAGAQQRLADGTRAGWVSVTPLMPNARAALLCGSILGHNSGPYGAPTYVILLFRPATLHYAEAPALSALTRETMGLFSVDAKRKRLIATSKSGGCIHYQSELAVSGDVPTTLSSEVQSIVFENDQCTVVVERTPEHGKPRTTRRPCSKDEMP